LRVNYFGVNMSRKEDILNAATILFSQKGFRDTSSTELARATGVAEGTVFYHYKNKEELFLAILKQVREDIISEFEGYIEKKEFESGLDMIESAVSFYMYLSVKMEHQFLLLHRHYPYELAEKNLKCREHLEAIYNCMVDIFEQAVLLGQKDGSIECRHTRKTALIIFSMVDGIVKFKIYNLYDAGALFNELIETCRKILKPVRS